MSLPSSLSMRVQTLDPAKIQDRSAIAAFCLPPGAPFPTGPVQYNYFNKTIYSSHTFAAGDSAFGLFDQTDSPALSLYNRGQNFFESNQGRIMAGRALIKTSGVGAPELTFASGVALATALSLLVKQLSYTININSVPVHKGLFNELHPDIPIIVSASEATPVGYRPGPYPVFPHGGNINNWGAENFLVAWMPPLVVPNGNTVQIRCEFPPGVTVPAALVGFILFLELKIEEIPNQMSQTPRM